MLSALAQQTALAGIGLYQRHLSPRKGYSCAYRVAHGGPGCSGFAKEQIRAAGMWAALPAIRARFAACKAAAQQIHGDDATARARKRKRRNGINWCDITLCCGSAAPACGPGAASTSASEGGANACNTLDGCNGCDSPCSGCDACSCGS